MLAHLLSSPDSSIYIYIYIVVQHKEPPLWKLLLFMRVCITFVLCRLVCSLLALHTHLARLAPQHHAAADQLLQLTGLSVLEGGIIDDVAGQLNRVSRKMAVLHTNIALSRNLSPAQSQPLEPGVFEALVQNVASDGNLILGVLLQLLCARVLKGPALLGVLIKMLRCNDNGPSSNVHMMMDGFQRPPAKQHR